MSRLDFLDWQWHNQRQKFVALRKRHLIPKPAKPKKPKPIQHEYIYTDHVRQRAEERGLVDYLYVDKLKEAKSSKDLDGTVYYLFDNGVYLIGNVESNKTIFITIYQLIF